MASHHTPKRMKKNEESVFKTPMTFSPSLLHGSSVPRPSPSRIEMWREELGLTDDSDLGPDSAGDSASDSDCSQGDGHHGNRRKAHRNHTCNSSFTDREFELLQRELLERNNQRDELLFRVKTLTDKSKQYKSRLDTEEANKRQQIRILQKTHETLAQDKQSLIQSLQDLLDEHEARVERGDTSPCPPSVRALTAQITSLTADKHALTRDLLEARAAVESSAAPREDEVAELRRRLEDAQDDARRVTDTLTEQCTLKVMSETERVEDEYRAELTRCQASLRAAESEVARLQSELQASRSEVARLQSELQASRSEVERVTTELGASQQSVSDLGREIAGLREDVKEKSSLHNQNSELLSETAALQKQVETLASENSQLSENIGNLRSERETLGAERDSLLAGNNSLTAELSRVGEECSVAQRLAADREQQLLQCNQEAADSAKLASAHDKLTHDLEALTSTLAKVKGQSEREAAVSKAEIDDLQQQLQTQSRETQAATELLSQSLAEQQSHSAELEGALQRETERRTELEAALQRETESGAQLELALQRETGRGDGLERVLDAERARVADGEHQIGQYKSELLTLRVQMTEEVNILQEAREAEVQALTERSHAQLSQSQDRLRASEDQLRTARVQSEKDMKTLQKKHEQSSRETRERLSTVCRCLVDIHRAMVRLRADYDDLRRACEGIPAQQQRVIDATAKTLVSAVQGISEYNTDLVRKYRAEMALRKKYHNELVELRGNIRVLCRVRPPISEDGCAADVTPVVTFDPEDDGVISVTHRDRRQNFELDRVFTWDSTQEEVFDEVKALVTSSIDGFNVCIFAYGQTGSGKTYTMEGTKDAPGLNQRALRELFRETRARSRDWSFTVNVSVMEIYNENLRDLLSAEESRLDIKMNPEGGLYVPGLVTYEVNSVTDVNQVFLYGQENRATAATNMNEHSSRSHALLCATITGVNKTTGARTNGKLNLVDLAGSERVSKSGAEGVRLREAQSINKSLSTLGDVIHALRNKQAHVPYRNSKLTYLLQDSLGGDSKTLMIVQVAPVDKNVVETLASLNFAQRVRSVELGQASRRVDDGTEPSTPLKSTTKANIIPRSSTKATKK